MELRLTPEQWARFMSNVEINDQQCWIWQRAKQANGYGKVTFRGASPTRSWIAHRAAWVHLRGPISAGLVLDHLCRVRACVNPDHLELVTQKENVRRGNLPGIKKVCPPDHTRSANRKGYGFCKTCANAATRRWHQRKRLEASPRKGC